MDLLLLATAILIVISFVFFIWGTAIASVKHVGAGGIFLSVATFMILLGAK
jgi:hypothetical protein